MAVQKLIFVILFTSVVNASALFYFLKDHKNQHNEEVEHHNYHYHYHDEHKHREHPKHPYHKYQGYHEEHNHNEHQKHHEHKQHEDKHPQQQMRKHEHDHHYHHGHEQHKHPQFPKHHEEHKHLEEHGHHEEHKHRQHDHKQQNHKNHQHSHYEHDHRNHKHEPGHRDHKHEHSHHDHKHEPGHRDHKHEHSHHDHKHEHSHRDHKHEHSHCDHKQEHGHNGHKHDHSHHDHKYQEHNEEHKQQIFQGQPHYEFRYGVRDPTTGDIKNQWEVRKGDDVLGEYSLVEADGTVRVVQYTAGKHTGFNAVVKKEGRAKHPTGEIQGNKAEKTYHNIKPVHQEPVREVYEPKPKIGNLFADVESSPMSYAAEPELPYNHKPIFTGIDEETNLLALYKNYPVHNIFAQEETRFDYGLNEYLSKRSYDLSKVTEFLNASPRTIQNSKFLRAARGSFVMGR